MPSVNGMPHQRVGEQAPSDTDESQSIFQSYELMRTADVKAMHSTGPRVRDVWVSSRLALGCKESWTSGSQALLDSSVHICCIQEVKLAIAYNLTSRI
ncbi:hypothetical protein PAXRUDRAFT_332577 [Paxillus rubicundulus Ve08.2h10]|uniref:Uncharacterized protein n=1 Tax=Paxillus rubicundulus Ve08.2h10 TaxID=930991 RepID=A0A0D0DEX2_9AGAM|nr:hypothetical protein PAXRUDRAFT_332577 [Paxillus rubicundulus Ve08.2h10]